MARAAAADTGDEYGDGDPIGEPDDVIPPYAAD